MVHSRGRLAVITSFDRGQWLSLAVAALFVGALVAIVGVVVSALGAPEPGVFDDWGRVDDIARRVASWEYLLVGFVGGLVIVTRLVHPRWSRPLVGLAVLYLAVLTVAAVMGAVTVLERQTLQLDGSRPAVDYYTADERLGEIIVFGALLIPILAMLLMLVVSAVAGEYRVRELDEPAAGSA